MYSETMLRWVGCSQKRQISPPILRDSPFRHSSDGIKTRTTKPKVLMVNHGYPPQFSGGSEVYAQTLALQLNKSGRCGEVNVMAREHDPFRPDFVVRRTFDAADSSLPVYLLNYPRECAYYKFLSSDIDDAFRELVQKLKPDVVHFHHVNHLSLNLPRIAKEAGSAVVYTLHDFWLMCPRGQFLITGPTAQEPWQICNGQNDAKCAANCYTKRYATGCSSSEQSELKYWTRWIGARMEAVHAACDSIDAFISPSHHLKHKFVTQFLIPEDKILLLPYGFDRQRLAGRQRARPFVEESSDNEPYVFAYIGRHQPSKGINLLIEAALKLIKDDPSIIGRFAVHVFGRADMNSTAALQRLVSEALPSACAPSALFQWHPEYDNFAIVNDVFNHVDAIVVPSIWEENSPLVIQEAQQAGVPVITSAAGGMEELVKNKVNGLTFKHRDRDSLAAAMLKALNDPSSMSAMGARGYLLSESSDVPCAVEHADRILKLYARLLHGVATDVNELLEK